MFEHRSEPVISRPRFLKRLAIALLLSAGLIALSLLVGAIGYRVTEGMSWLDALLNATMILTGMGPVSDLRTEDGKVFAMLYALFSGVVFLSVAAVLLAPVAHRLLHRLHLDSEESVEAEPPAFPRR